MHHNLFFGFVVGIIDKCMMVGVQKIKKKKNAGKKKQQIMILLERHMLFSSLLCSKLFSFLHMEIHTCLGLFLYNSSVCDDHHVHPENPVQSFPNFLSNFGVMQFFCSISLYKKLH